MWMSVLLVLFGEGSPDVHRPCEDTPGVRWFGIVRAQGLAAILASIHVRILLGRAHDEVGRPEARVIVTAMRQLSLLVVFGVARVSPGLGEILCHQLGMAEVGEGPRNHVVVLVGVVDSPLCSREPRGRPALARDDHVGASHAVVPPPLPHIETPA